MPPTRRQIDRTLNVQGHAFIKPKDVPGLAARYTESYIRRRIFAMEDDAVIQQYRMYRDALRDIRTIAHDTADREGLRKLNNSRVGVAWRDNFLYATNQRLQELAADVAMLTYDTAVQTYLMSFYGRAWSLTQTTTATVRVPKLSLTQASQAILDSPLREATPERVSVATTQARQTAQTAFGDRQVLSQQGGDFWQQFVDHTAELTVKIRRMVNRGLSAQQTIPEVVDGVSKVVGVSLRDKEVMNQNFHKTQMLTRSYVMQGAYEGAFDLYHENRHIVTRVFFVTAFDGRVCPVCNGIFAASAIEGGYPLESAIIVPTPIHHGCRCGWMAWASNEVRVDDETDPYWTFGEFADEYMLDDLLGELVDDTEIDSTQVDAEMELI